jgi:hypothetical protein
MWEDEMNVQCALRLGVGHMELICNANRPYVMGEDGINVHTHTHIYIANTPKYIYIAHTSIYIAHTYRTYGIPGTHIYIAHTHTYCNLHVHPYMLDIHIAHGCS